ncbi:MAG: hypothetical protein H7841_17455 [Magnetospirillum sp. WYHS-4]
MHALLLDLPGQGLDVAGRLTGLVVDIGGRQPDQGLSGFRDAQAFFHETLDNDHGRLEIRHWSIGDVDWLRKRHDWAGLTSIGMIERQVERVLAERGSADPALGAVPLDLPLLEMVIEELERFRAERGLSWSPERKARLIGLGYGMMLEEKESSGGKAEAGRLAYLFKAAS